MNEYIYLLLEGSYKNEHKDMNSEEVEKKRLRAEAIQKA